MFNSLPEYMLQSRVEDPGAKIYLIRSLDSNDDVIHGWKDTVISEVGLASSHKIAGFLMNKGIRNLYSSDLKRTTETAKIIGSALSIEPHNDPDLRPWDVGILRFFSESVSQLGFYIDEFPDRPIKGGESYHTFYDRAKTAIHKYVAAAVRNNQTICLVTHSSVFYTLSSIITNVSHTKFDPTVKVGGVLKLSLGRDISIQRVY